MKLVTFVQNGVNAVGLVDGDAVLDLPAAWRKFGGGDPPLDMLALIAGGQTLLAEVRRVSIAAAALKGDTSLWQPLSLIKLKAPIPHGRKNVFCVGRNYKLHIEEGARARGREVVFPTVPEFFSKPPTTVIGHDENIRLDPKVTQQLDYEVELAIVIGKTIRDLSPANVADAIFGYTIVNDVSARDLQVRHGQWFKGKGLDTTCPTGPWIVTKDEFGDPSGHRISLRVNGETRQDSNTADLLFDCAAIVSSLSHGLTIEAGDIIATGTPSGVALGMSPQKWLKHGDVIEAEVEGVGVLRNRVREVGSKGD
jgi:2-keto-4-pentenoate hydratase/2-oxohepta-3-ene-1,7-dioic acid hydratase in catechol pathway